MKTNDYLLKLRKTKKLTQAELGELMTVSHQAVSKWESGETLPDIYVLIKLAEFYETSVEDIIAGGTEVSSEVIEMESPNRIDFSVARKYSVQTLITSVVLLILTFVKVFRFPVMLPRTIIEHGSLNYLGPFVEGIPSEKSIFNLMFSGSGWINDFMIFAFIYILLELAISISHLIKSYEYILIQLYVRAIGSSILLSVFIVIAINLYIKNGIYVKFTFIFIIIALASYLRSFVLSGYRKLIRKHFLKNLKILFSNVLNQ